MSEGDGALAGFRWCGAVPEVRHGAATLGVTNSARDGREWQQTATGGSECGGCLGCVWRESRSGYVFGKGRGCRDGAWHGGDPSGDGGRLRLVARWDGFSVVEGGNGAAAWLALAAAKLAMAAEQRDDD